MPDQDYRSPYLLEQRAEGADILSIVYLSIGEGSDPSAIEPVLCPSLILALLQDQIIRQLDRQDKIGTEGDHSVNGGGARRRSGQTTGHHRNKADTACQ